MVSETEFPVPTRNESERIKQYLKNESQFMAVKNFFGTYQNVILRQRVVSIIAKVSRSIFSDAFIPYLAMNYFDRVFSRHARILMDKAVEGRNESEKLLLIATCCLTLSAKLRIKNFSVAQFLRDTGICHVRVMKVEHLILDELHWEMQSVTAFCFLNHYYPYFKQFGGFKRQCINEIIVQAQGENTFIEYTPSQIALSAFLAASKIAYPSKYVKIANPSNFHKIDNEEEVTKCLNQMVDLCSRLNIHIEPAESGIGTTCSRVLVVNSSQSQAAVMGSSKSRMVVVVDSSKSQAVVVESSEEEEKEDGTALIRKQRTSKAQEIQHRKRKEVVVESCDEEEEEKLETSNAPEIEHSDGKAVVVDSSNGKAVLVECDEEEEKEDETALIKKLGTSKPQEKLTEDPSQVQVEKLTEEDNKGKGKVTEEDIEGKDKAVDVTEIPVDDEDRVEAIIRRSLEKRKAVEGEEPQLQMGICISEIVGLVEPMNFELKWPS